MSDCNTEDLMYNEYDTLNGLDFTIKHCKMNLTAQTLFLCHVLCFIWIDILLYSDTYSILTHTQLLF